MTDYNDDMGEEFLDIDTDSAQEPAAVEPGEYQIRITGFLKDQEGRIVRTNSNGGRFFMVNFDIPSEEFSKGFSKYFGIPDETMDAKAQNGAKYGLKIFKAAFGMEELNFSNMVGREGYALLGLKEDAEYGEQNFISKFIAGA